MIDLKKLRKEIQAVADAGFFHAGVSNKEVLDLIDYAAALEKDAGRLDWMDRQVKGHVVYNGYTWQEAGYENNRGLVCAIQSKKQKLSVRQAIDTAMESNHG